LPLIEEVKSKYMWQYKTTNHLDVSHTSKKNYNYF